MTMHSIFNYTLTIAALSLLFSCSSNDVVFSLEADTSEIVLSEAQKELIGYQVADVEWMNFFEKVEFTGQIEVPPQYLISIHAPIVGRVEEAPFIEGDRVKKGQVIARLAHPGIMELQLEFVRKREVLTFLKQEYERQQALFKNQSGTEKAFQEAFKNYQLAQLEWKALVARLQYLKLDTAKLLEGNLVESLPILSPVNGTITELAINFGKLVAEDEFLFELVDKEHLHLAIDIFEKDAHLLESGQRITFRLPGSKNQHYGAELVLIGQKVDPVKRTILMHAHPDEDLDIFIPGMKVTGEIRVGAEKGFGIPASALVQMEGSNFVFLEVEGAVKLQPVNVLRELNSFVQIEEELKNVVTGGAWYLKGLMQKE